MAINPELQSELHALIEQVVRDVSLQLNQQAPQVKLTDALIKELSAKFISNVSTHFFNSNIGTNNGQRFWNENIEATIHKLSASLIQGLANEIQRLGGIEPLASRFSTEFVKGIASELQNQTPLVKELTGEIAKEAGNQIVTTGRTMLREYPEEIGRFTSRLYKFTAKPLAKFGSLGVVVILGSSLAFLYAYHVAKHNIGKPSLAIEQRRTNTISQLYNWFIETSRTHAPGLLPPPPVSKKVEPIFNADIERQIQDFSNSLTTVTDSLESSDYPMYFQNMLLYGPGGTGKTMIAKKIADESGLDYIMMSGGDLAQYIARGTHVTELNNLMKSITRPTILFIDEFESLARDRTNLTGPYLELQNAFLSHTGEPSKKLIIIAATNRAQDLDKAILNRFDYQLAIDPPALEERIKIVREYAKKMFAEEEQTRLFSEEQIRSIAKNIEGFTGRTISKMFNAMNLKKAKTPDKRLTESIIDQTITDFVRQETKKTQATCPTDVAAQVLKTANFQVYKQETIPSVI